VCSQSLPRPPKAGGRLWLCLSELVNGGALVACRPLPTAQTQNRVQRGERSACCPVAGNKRHCITTSWTSTRLDRVSESYMPAKFVAVAKGRGKRQSRSGPRRYVERKNGTLRQWCKRLTRLTLRFLEIMGQPSRRSCSPFCVLQSVQDSWIADHASHGGRNR
jgi:hypothetical protein